jgi:CubicO group peptidase (beta-lactamase class C family)
VARAAAAAGSARRRRPPLNSRACGAAFLALLTLLLCACGGGGDDGGSVVVDETNAWSSADPGDLAVDASALERIGEQIPAEFPYVRSLLVARDGRLVFERYYGGAAVDQVFEVYSITKSVTSALVGIALADGKLESVDQRLVDFFPGYAGAADPRVRRVTLGDLLTMRAGFLEEPIAASRNWIRTLMTRPLEHDPGTAFLYDSGSSHLLSAVLTKVTGEQAAALARERIFRPLGITGGWQWPDDGQGVSIGGDGLSMRARDLAKLGQLYLQEGRWDGKQIVPAAWVRRSTRRHTSVGAPGQWYGYQWWVQDGPRGQAYAALGFGGQAIVVWPRLDLVVVLTTAPRGQTDVRTIMRRILPAVESR